MAKQDLQRTEISPGLNNMTNLTLAIMSYLIISISEKKGPPSILSYCLLKWIITSKTSRKSPPHYSLGPRAAAAGHG